MRDPPAKPPPEPKRAAPLEAIESELEGWLMDLAQWLPAEFGKHKLSPKYVELVFNLTNCGNERGAAAVQPGQQPYELEELTHAVHGYIVAKHTDPWFQDPRNRGSPRGLYWLLRSRDNVARYAEIGRNQWDAWRQREQKRRDAIRQSEQRGKG